MKERNAKPQMSHIKTVLGIHLLTNQMMNNNPYEYNHGTTNDTDKCKCVLALKLGGQSNHSLLEAQH